MTKSIIALALLLSSTISFAEDLICTVSVNLEQVAEVEVSVAPKSKVEYINAEDFVFYVNNKGDSKFELEVLDVSAPSRSYALGTLKTLDDELTWTLWSRDILLETSCKLSGKK